jgi:hypothetical protein
MYFLNSVFKKLIMCISYSLYKHKGSLNINARIIIKRAGFIT